ncbi:MAG: hypothetical protein KAS11_04865 [Candidatus Aenigmarchaeota archaeon]|nr:hypothetical protein [Candidatus Aenigmarchaeota archaeon]
MAAGADILLKVFAMVKKAHTKRKAEEKKIKTESGKRLYALIREDLSHSRRMKRILSRAAASLFIVVIIILLVMYFV